MSQCQRATLALLLALGVGTAGCSGSGKKQPKSSTASSSDAAAKADAPAAKADSKDDKSGDPMAQNAIPAPTDVAKAPDDAATTASGLAHKVVTPGQAGDKPRAWDEVTVNYTGWTTDGKMFDSSLVSRIPGMPPKPTSFALNNVIAGWTEGVQLMVPGEKRRFWIPEALAYKGQMGAPQGTLVFDVELVSVKRMPDPPAVPTDVGAAPADAAKEASGLASKVITKGTGKSHPKATDTVRVHYTGWTTDGKMFDSSVTRGEPVTFPLDKVVKGWGDGVQLMVVGEKRRLWIPEELAYKGRPGAPQGTLVFDIELLDIVTPETPADVAAVPKDAIKTASGIASKVLKKGTGTEHPTSASTVKVDYSGWTTDGKMFDSSVTRGQPATFPLTGVIPGWTEGVQLMVVGEKRRLWIPEALAYKGRDGAPKGMLVFDIELLELPKAAP